MRLRQQHSDAARGQIEAALGAAEARVTASAERLAAHELKVKSQEREILRLMRTFLFSHTWWSCSDELVLCE